MAHMDGNEGSYHHMDLEGALSLFTTKMEKGNSTIAVFLGETLSEGAKSWGVVRRR